MTMFEWGVALAALLGVFWVIGAYNRLTRLRAAVVDRYGVLDEILTRYVLWIQGCLPDDIRTDFSTQPAPLEPTAPPDQAGPWLRLKASLDQYLQAIAQARRRPLDGEAMAALVLAHATLAAAWAGAMQDQQQSEAELTERQQLRRARLLSQCVPLRDAYNEAVKTYNAAITQFPAWLLARMLRFRPAGNLVRLALES
ncbi:MAG: hypothetical protein H6928_13440 [Burkholderiaceae bacterium]|uniref:hypothetical protein n=1 Tax=Ottowia sp. TaxID=1898956 RepID=UPI001DFF1AA4|nr:hypothetical protein [Ottowia sp.]MCB2024559.1 hypothetical protein [Ottowia sp.]MCP5258935.1 hypothetical protein [Burkholderiaceae bacterium]HRW70903.1 hypothetical protein [Ottowia sp.]